MDYGNYKATSGQFKIKSMYFANSQTSDVFAYTGTYEGKASYNEIDGTYSFSVDLNIWNRITLVYNGTALSMQDLNVTGAFTYSNMAPWDTTLFCDAPDDYSLVDWTTLICSCSNNVTYTFTYNPITNTLRIDAKEDNGVPEIPANGFYIEVFDTNAFVYGSNTDETTVNLKQWWRVKLYFDGNPLSVNDITITGDYGYFDMSNKDLYNDSAEGDNIILCDYYSENGIQYTFSYDRYTNTLDIQDDEKEVVEELPVNGFFYRYTAVDTTLMPWQEVYPASDTTYTFVVELNAWRYVEIYYNGKQISITDSYFTYNLFDGVYIDGMYTERFYVNSTNTYEFVYTPAIYSAYADLLARKYDEPQGPIETDGYVFKVSSDEYAAVFTDSNALVDTKSRWRLYIVVDDKGKIAYMCEFPINGYGGPADNTYIRHSDYSDYMSNPAFNILDGYAPWQPGYNYYNLYEVKVPFGGFALELYSGDEDVQKFMKAITGISYCEHAINDNSINVDNIRLTYDYADKVRVSIVKEEPTEPEVPGIKEVYLGTFGSTDIKAYATLDGNLLTMRYEAVDAYSVGEINQFFIFDNDVVYEVRFNQASWTGIWNWTTSNWEYWTSQIAVPTYMTENGLYVMTQVIDLEYFTNLGLDVSTIKFNVGENLIGETNLIHNGNRVDFNNHSTWVVLAGTLNIFVDRYNDGGWGDTTTWTYLSNNLSGDFKVVTVFEMETNDFESNWWRGVLPIVQHETGSNLNDGSCWVTRFDWWGWCDQWYSNDKLTNIWSDAGANQNIIVDCYWSDELGNDVSANDFVLAMTKSTITWTCTRNGNTVRNDFVITLEDGRVFTYWSLADDIDINKNLNIALSAEFAKYTVKSITVQ